MIFQDLKKHNLSDAPGVYFFLDGQKKPLYIGKATSLKDRVKSYFTKDISETRSPLIAKMVSEAKSIDFRKTSSVLEALLLEADLIKKFKPKFNTKEKDDKSFNCVVITKEDFPQVLIKRKKDIQENSKDYQKIFGPFSNGGQLKEALRIVHKIFAFRDEKCELGSKCPCFNYSLGLCPGTCIGKIDKKLYSKTIKNIMKFLSGNIKSVSSGLEKDMNTLAKKHKFEEAKILRDKIYALNHINDVALIKSDSAKKSRLEGENFRIESFDIAHMSGKDMVGVMTVLEGGEIKKSDYRKFKIETCDNANDPKALKEVLERRFDHTEWTFPDLIVVDGGAIQINVANQFVLSKGLKISVVSVVKDSRHKAKGILGQENLAKKYKKEIILANAESHRFAISFHKKLRSKNFLA